MRARTGIRARNTNKSKRARRLRGWKRAMNLMSFVFAVSAQTSKDGFEYKMKSMNVEARQAEIMRTNDWRPDEGLREG
jgi:hypothetical protein